MVSVARVGLGVRTNSVSIVAVDGDDIVWAGAGSFDSVDELESIVVDLLKQVPRPRWRRAGAVAAVSPSRCQTRPIVGLPPVRDAAMAAGLVRENAGRFFLCNGVPLTTASTVVASDGTWWSAAFEEPVLGVIRSACAKSGIKVEAFVPAIAILAGAISSKEIVWRDGDVTMLSRFDRGRLVECRRINREASADSVPFARALDAFGAEASVYVDAYAAAVRKPLRDIPSVPGTTDAERNATPRWRLVVATVSTCIAATAALAGPPLQARYAADQAQRETASLERTARQALTDEADLARFRGALAEFSGLAGSSARPVTRLLSTLASSLPDSSALVSVRVDTATAQVVVLAPRAATVLARLERSPLIANPRIVGPITREKVGGRDAERVTVRFERR